MSVSTEAGNRTGSKRECLPSCHRQSTDSDYRYGPATDYGRVRDDGHSSTVYIPYTCVCPNRGASIVATVDYADRK